MQPATAAAEDGLTSTDRPAHSEERTVRLTRGSMLILADDLRTDDRQGADARRSIGRPAATMAADQGPAMAGARWPNRGGSLMWAGLRRIISIGQDA